MANVKYSVQIDNPLTHCFTITINVTPVSKQACQFWLPNWIPGSYMIRDFAKHVIDPKAFDEQTQLTIEHVSKNRLQVQHNNTPFTLTYQYYAFDLTVRKAYLDQEFGFLNPCAAMFCVKGFESTPLHIDLVKPNHTDCRGWQMATGLSKTQPENKFDWGEYQADNYEDLTECPILFGQLDIAEFEVNKVPHYMVTAGKHFGDLSRVTKDLISICQYHCDTFGGLPKDLDQYLFLTMITDNGFGGLEHTNSTALLCSRYDIAANKDSIKENDDYVTFLSLCSHEYLHTWNVKRLKPKEFIPYSFEQEVYTQQLWFYEGMTSYFDDLSLLHTQTIDTTQYLTIFAKTLTRIQRGYGQLRQSITDSSFHTWSKFYQQDESAPDQITSYYQKGAAIACLVDVIIRYESNGVKSLKDVMKAAWKQYGANEVGTTQDDLQQLFLQHLPQQYHQTFLDALYKTNKLDLTEIFKLVGVNLSYHNQVNYTQFNYTDDINENWLGAMLTGGFPKKVKQVLENSPAQQAGLAVGDELISIDGIKVSDKSIKHLLQKNASLRVGVEIKYFRKDQLFSGHLPLQQSEKFVAQLSIVDHKQASIWTNA